jgi:hypothetical protein
MAHVQIHTPGVRQKSSVAGRFIVPSMVQIEDASPLNVKEMVSDLVGEPGGGMVGPLLIHQKPVFGFKPENTVQHLNSPRQTEARPVGGVTGPPV